MRRPRPAAGTIAPIRGPWLGGGDAVVTVASVTQAVLAHVQPRLGVAVHVAIDHASADQQVIGPIGLALAEQKRQAPLRRYAMFMWVVIGAMALVGFFWVKTRRERKARGVTYVPNN